jgi:hypothetical protein
MNREEAPDPRTDATWLAAALAEEAGSHEPDLGRVMARTEQLIAETQGSGAAPGRTAARAGRVGHVGRGGLLRLRLVGIPLGLLVVLASATVAVAVSLNLRSGGTPPRVGPVSASSSHAAPEPQPSRPSAPPPSTAHQPPTSSAGSSRRAGGELTAATTLDSHSNKYWAQENLTVTLAHGVRTLEITTVVSSGSGVNPTGVWSTVPGEVDTQMNQTPDGIVYKITLKPGKVLSAGTYEFGFQFNHPVSGHAFSSDTYRISAVTTDGSSAPVSSSGVF